MFINIITACSRPENLITISKSINIPKENYRWIVVFDFNELPQMDLIPDNCEYYLHKNPNSNVGNAQKNFALDLINDNDSYVYFNDDDTIIHKNLWQTIKDLDNDFISFAQEDNNGRIRLNNNFVKVGYIDSHNFIVKRDIISDNKWIIEKYEADGYFAVECFKNSKKSGYIPSILSTYNSLRKN